MRRPGRFLMMLALAGLATAFSLAPNAADGPKGAAKPGQIQVQQVEVRLSQVGHVVLLKIKNKAIPIFVDAIVAQSIQGALSGTKTPRPLTHDLVHTILQSYDGRVSQVVVTLKDRIFYAALTVVVKGSSKVFDSRSSDAIALAIHFKAPIIVDQELLDASGIVLDEEKERPEGKPEFRT